jgi:DNA-binding transcriptional LysR family regulator
MLVQIAMSGDRLCGNGGMDWDDLRLFLAVAREGTMLGAAARLGVSQALLSRHVAALEESTGARLFERTTRGSTLTPAGEALMRSAERMEWAAEEGLEAVRGGGEISGTVRIGAPDGFGSAFLAPRLGRIRAAHAGLRLELVPLPRAFSLSAREADLAVMVGRPESGRLIVRHLTDYGLGLYAARDYLERAGAPRTAADLSAHPVVGYVDDLVPAPALRYAEELIPGRVPDVAVSTAVGQVEAVRAGAGIGVLHDFMAAEVPNLVRVLPEAVARRAYWLARHENLRGARRVDAVADGLSDMVRDARAIFMPPARPL